MCSNQLSIYGAETVHCAVHHKPSKQQCYNGYAIVEKAGVNGAPETAQPAACSLHCPTCIQEPNNETYRKALEMCKKAPEYCDEIQTQLQQVG